MSRSGGRILADQLELNGAELAFCLPGESFLPLLDAFYDSPVRLVTCRHEQGAANAAEAYGKLTGRPGICIVTRGPGSTQAAVGVHTAKQDSTPMILLVGHVPRAFEGREAWQELDYARVFGGIAKAAWHVDRADRIPEHVGRAFSLALSGRPGPVVLALPEDVLAEEADAVDAAPVEIARAAPREEDVHRLRELLDGAERPLVIAGEGGWTKETGEGVIAFCEASELPVACAFRCQDFVDNRSPSYAGVLGVAMDEQLASRVREADLVIAVGGRLGEVPTRRYTLLEPPRPRQTLVHAHPDPDELGFVYEPDLPILSGLPELAAALRELEPVEPRWREWTNAARADYEQNLRHEPMEGPVDLGEIMAFLRGRLPADAIQTCGAGNFTVWAHRFAEFTQYGTQVCPRSGSMGYGVAAAVAAKLVHPARMALCFTGDGDFVMSSPEFATAVQYDLPILVLLVNNGMYATIRMHQERQFPGRVIGTDLVNPDFPSLAQAYGGYGERVERTDDFEAAFERALASGKPALLELPVDPERISPRITLGELQAQAR
ncbi:MAG: thiamine pyrophosphate-binding protein [Gaiellaceae bacterium]